MANADEESEDEKEAWDQTGSAKVRDDGYRPKRREGVDTTDAKARAREESKPQAQPQKEKRQLKAKFECQERGRAGGTLPQVEHASLQQVMDRKVRVLSVDPSIFEDPKVIPWVDLYAGAGGMSFGSVETQENGFKLVCVLTTVERAR